jgi:hypothetical protein
MKPYRNIGRRSGVVAYELRPGAIVVRFHSGDTYEYTEASAGRHAVAAMQRFAAAGQGLSGFIARHKPAYASRRLADGG